MTLTQLQYFNSVYESGNFTWAADELHISRSAVSLAVKELEEELGVQLFKRLKNGVQPTKKGEEFYRQAVVVLSETDSLMRRMRDDGSEHKRLEIGIAPSVNGIIFPDLIRDFRAANPDVDLMVNETTEHAIRQKLTEGVVDAVLLPVEGSYGEGFGRLRLRSPEVRFCVPSGHRLAGERAVSYELMKDEPLAHLGEGVSLLTALKDFCDREKLLKNIRMRSTQLYAVMRLVAGGGCCAFMYEGVSRFIDGVVELPLEPRAEGGTELVWNRKRERNPDVRRFLEFVKSYSKQAVTNTL